MPYSLLSADKEPICSPVFNATLFVIDLRSSSDIPFSNFTIMPISPPDFTSSAVFSIVFSELSLITISILPDSRLFSVFGHLFWNLSSNVKLSEVSSHDIPK